MCVLFNDHWECRSSHQRNSSGSQSRINTRAHEAMKLDDRGSEIYCNYRRQTLDRTQTSKDAGHDLAGCSQSQRMREKQKKV